MPGSLRLGKVAGIGIEVNVSWLIIFVLLTASLATSWFPQLVPHLAAGTYWGLGALAVVLLFASVLAHELAHSLVARARGLPVTSITLFVFGGVSNIEREPQSPGVEFQMAFVGPLTSLLIAAAAWPAAAYVAAQSAMWAAVLEYVSVSNLLLGMFNLLPGFPMDGGRVLRSIIWKATGSLHTATRWATRVGQGFGYLFIAGGILMVLSVDLITGLWSAFIGWFLLNAAQTAYAQEELTTRLRGITVAQAMQPAAAIVSAELSLQQLVDGYILPSGVRTLPVVQAERLVGLITLRDVQRVPRERWGVVTVGQAMTPLERLQVAHPEQAVEAVLPLLVAHDVNQLPVVEGGRLVGMLSRDAILRLLDVRQRLGAPAVAPSPPAAPTPPERQPVAR